MRLSVLLLVAHLVCAGGATAQTLAPPAIRDTSFAGTINRLSEPGGYFDTDNLISNESSYLHVIGGLDGLGLRGGAYLGVGPDQNFSYIARLRPDIAILIDIRRDNLLEHLLMKALFEISRDRMEYLALLLARPVPDSRSPDASIESIVAHLDTVAFSQQILDTTRDRVHRRITTYGLSLAETDLATIDRFHRTFATRGLDLRFETFGRPSQFYYPTLRDLILERDRDGRRVSYLASDAAYQTVRGLHLRNRIIPMVGDLAGGTALPAIARFLREQETPLSAYYTSNVEFYLANDGTLRAFLDNVARLPRAPHAVIIRSIFRRQHPQSVSGYYSTQLLQSIDSLVAADAAGRIRGYDDLIHTGIIDLRQYQSR